MTRVVKDQFGEPVLRIQRKEGGDGQYLEVSDVYGTNGWGEPIWHSPVKIPVLEEVRQALIEELGE